jgi:hypothetical protein
MLSMRSGDLKQGDRVRCNGYPGAFVRDYYGMAEVRVPGGVCCVVYSELKPGFWRVTQGTSRARVGAINYQAAVARAAEIGFKRPDSVVLDESREE